MAGHHQREAGHARSGFFIGSSREALPVAEAFQKGLDKHIVTTVWSEKSVFKPSEYTLDSLERALDRFPYALLILSPDDITHSRGKEETSARDNAIFELGLFVGRHGRRSVDDYETIFGGETLRTIAAASIIESTPGCADCGFQSWCGADPVFHYATQGDIVPHIPTSAFHEKHFFLFTHLLSLYESDPRARRVFWSWIRNEPLAAVA
jgi:hypothetical protein